MSNSVSFSESTWNLHRVGGWPGGTLSRSRFSVLPGPIGGCSWWLEEPCATSEPALSWVSGENTGCSFLCGSQLELLVVPALQLGMLPILYKVCPSCFILFQSPGETGQSPDAYLSLLSLELLWTCILHNASLNHRKGGQFNVLY